MYRVLFLLLLPILLFSKFQVTTHFPLQTFIVKQIGQNHIRIKEINNLFSYEARDLDYDEKDRFSRVKAYFHFGFNSELEYARQLKEVNQTLKVVDMSKGIKKDSFNGEVNHYIWLDPLLMRTVARNVYETLLFFDKFNKDDYKYNYDNFLNKLDELFLNTKKSLDESEIYNLFVYDENWHYFAKRFRLKLYRKEKILIKTNEYEQNREFINKHYIKALLIQPHDSYIIAQSLVGKNDVKIVTHNIFDKVYFYNIAQLTKELSSQ